MFSARFWYENPGVFSDLQVAEIKRFSLAKALCHSGDEIDRVQDDVFVYVGDSVSAYRLCSEIPDMNLNMWQDCCDGDGAHRYSLGPNV